jgi:hypothetical protein
MIPNLTSGQSELGVAGCEAHVAAERHLERPAHARAVDLTHDRLGHLFAEVRAVQEHAPVSAQHTWLTGKGRELAEVDTGGEDRSIAAQHNAVHTLLVAGGPEGVAELGEQLLAHRVALLRAVQDDVANRTSVFADDERHRWAP